MLCACPGPLRASLSSCGDAEDRLLSPDPVWPLESYSPSLKIRIITGLSGRSAVGFKGLLAQSLTPWKSQLYCYFIIVTEWFSSLCRHLHVRASVTVTSFPDPHFADTQQHLSVRGPIPFLDADSRNHSSARTRQDRQSRISNIGISATSQNRGGFPVRVTAQASQHVVLGGCPRRGDSGTQAPSILIKHPSGDWRVVRDGFNPVLQTAHIASVHTPSRPSQLRGQKQYHRSRHRESILTLQRNVTAGTEGTRRASPLLLTQDSQPIPLLRLNEPSLYRAPGRTVPAPLPAQLPDSLLRRNGSVSPAFQGRNQDIAQKQEKSGNDVY